MSEYFSTNYYQVPAVYIEILGIQFGLVNLSDGTDYSYPTSWQRPRTPKSLSDGYPNMITKLEVEKLVDSDTNIYTISLAYVPDDGEDPSYIDKLISANMTQNGGKFYIAYGDASKDGFFRQKDEVMLTDYSMTIDLASSCMNYTISAMSISTIYDKAGVTREYPDYTDTTISAIIKSLYLDNTSGFETMFPGGIYIDDVNVLDIDPENPPDGFYEETTIPGGSYTPLNYLKYLVKMMFSEDIGTSTKSNYTYTWCFDDSVSRDSDTYSEGQRFMIYRTTGYENNDVVDEIVIGASEDSPVISYQFDTSFQYLLAMSYGSTDDSDSDIKYAIDENGNEYIIDNAKGVNKDNSEAAAERENAWYNSASALPYGMTLKIRGMKKQIPLMSNLGVTVMIKNVKHFTSGIYFVTGMKDIIDDDGYITELSMFKYPTDSEGNLTNQSTVAIPEDSEE